MALPYEDHIEGAAADYGTEHFTSEEFGTFDALEEHHYWYLHRRQVILEELIRAGVPRSARLLDLGCGIGTVATFLNSHGFSVDYSDVHGEALVRARENAERILGDKASARRFMRFDVLRTPLDAGYEGVLMLDVLEHLPDDHLALANATRALPRGGVAMFTVPAFQLLWSPWDELAHHKRRYTIAQARSLAESAGLVVQRATCFFFPLFFAALGVKALRKARELVAGPPQKAERFSELTESKTHPLLNRAMLAVLSTEHPMRRSAAYALGTSVMCVARKP